MVPTCNIELINHKSTFELHGQKKYKYISSKFLFRSQSELNRSKKQSSHHKITIYNQFYPHSMTFIIFEIYLTYMSDAK